MKDLQRHCKGAFEKINQLDPSGWSKAFFETHSMTDNTDNNMSECFNSWILRTRYMPLIDMLTEIHDKIMSRSCFVSLKNRTCSCRIWDLRGIPCSHVVTAIQQSRQNPVDFVAKWFTKETYMKTYFNCLEIIKGEEFWEEVEGDTVSTTDCEKA